jgi:hypothetical protein
MLEICPLSALPRGEARRVEADPPIAVFHTDDGEVFAPRLERPRRDRVAAADRSFDESAKKVRPLWIHTDVTATGRAATGRAWSTAQGLLREAGA